MRLTKPWGERAEAESAGAPGEASGSHDVSLTFLRCFLKVPPTPPTNPPSAQAKEAFVSFQQPIRSRLRIPFHTAATLSPPPTSHSFLLLESVCPWLLIQSHSTQSLVLPLNKCCLASSQRQQAATHDLITQQVSRAVPTLTPTCLKPTGIPCLLEFPSNNRDCTDSLVG